MSDLIGTDRPLDATQRATLAALANLLIPPSDDGRFPGAGDIDLLDYLQQWAGDSLATLAQTLDQLDNHARSAHDGGYADLDEPNRQAVLDDLRGAEPHFLGDLIRQTVACYYQNDRVLEAIGMEPRAPYPEGYEVPSGDLSLLDPVRARGQVYRDSGD